MRRVVMILVVMLMSYLVRAGNVAVTTVDATLADGLVVSGSVELVFSPIDAESVSLAVNGRTLLTATEPGTFAWSPERLGTYGIVHRTGDFVFTRKVVCPVSDGAKEMEIGWIDNPVSNCFPNVYASVTNVVIVPSVAQLPEGAFANSAALSSITIPASVKRIGANAFAECRSMTHVNVASLVDWLSIRFENPEANPLHLGASLCVGGEPLGGELVIPEGTQEIGVYAFANGKFSSVSIPNSVTKIGANAFWGCGGLACINVSCFADWLAIRFENVMANPLHTGASLCVGGELLGGELVIPDGTEEIGAYAFVNGKFLSVSIPNSVTKIGANAFWGCGGLKRINVPSLADWLAIRFENATANPLHTGAALYVDGVEVTELAIPEGTTEICDYAFQGASCAAVTIPDSVTNVAATAFSGCSNIVSVILGEGLFPETRLVAGFAGATDWIAETELLEGLPIYRSNAINHNASTAVEFVIPAGAEQLNFSWKVASESNYDWLTWYLDDVQKGRISGVRDWQPVSMALDGSSHRVRFVYSKDGNTSTSPDCGWVSIAVGGVSMSALFPDACGGIRELTIPTGIDCLDGGFLVGCTSLVSVTLPSRLAGVAAVHSRAMLESIVLTDVPAKIEDRQFSGCVRLSSFMIPDGTGEIGEEAFAGCEALTSVTIPNSVTNVASTAFAGCSNISEISLSQKILEGVSAVAAELVRLSNTPQLLWRGKRLSQVGESFSAYFTGTCIGSPQRVSSFQYKMVGDAVHVQFQKLEGEHAKCVGVSFSQGEDGVYGCVRYGRYASSSLFGQDFDEIASMTYGKTSDCEVEALVAEIPCSRTLASIFPDSYSKIRSLEIRDGMEVADDGCLDGCTSLVTVTLPSQLAGAAAEQSRATLESVVLTDVPEKIGDGMFADCVRLTAFVVPDGTVEIGEEAFAGCTALTSITIPESVKRIGANAFAGCTALTSLTLPTGLVDFSLDIIPEHLRASMGLAYDDDGFMIYNGWLLDYADKTVSELVVPDGVIGIGRLALANMEDLETVDLPSTLKYIGENAFRLDTYLDNVVIPDSAEVIGKGAFEMCTWIQTLTLGSGVKMVEDRAFAVCSSLFLANFAEGLESVGEEAFAGCESLASVSLPISLTHLASSAFTGCKRLIGVTTPTGAAPMSDWFAPVYKQIKNVTIPSGETLVCSNMFKDCAAMESIVLPEGVTNIAAGAFWNCTKLPSVVLPSSLVTVGESAFRNCGGLTAVGLPEAVADLGAYAFYDCGNLADLSLGKALRAIPSYAFANCPKLDSFVVPATVTNLGSRICGSSVRSIYYLGSAPSYADDAYALTSGSLVSYVESGTKGWDGIPSSRHLPDTWPVNNSRTLTTWSPVQYDVTFDAGDGLFAPVAANQYACEQIKGTAYSLPPFNPTRKGYKFGGWWTESVGGAQVTPSTGVKLDRAHTLYAHWIETLVVTVRFNACGGTVDPEEAEYTAEVPFGSFPVPTREHYVFVGWYTTPSGGTRMRESAEVPRADREVFARWTPAHYLIRFNANNGSGASASQDYIYGQTVTLRGNAFSCAGCQFAGWSLTPGGAAVYADGKTISELAAIEDGVMNLYAVWTGNVYAVRFDSHGGYGVMPNQTFVIGVAMPLSPCAFTRQGYVFKGWAVSTTAEVSYGDGQTVCDLTHQQAGTVVLYAVWERDATQEWTIEEYLNCTNLTFALGGDEPHWYGLKTSRADKQGMMRSGAIGDSQTNWIETVVSGPGTVSFWWKASGEYEVSKKGVVTMYDYAEFTVDGESVAEIGAESEWEPVELTVEGTGAHTLRWMYHKDESGSDGEDCAWVSEVVWTPSAAPAEAIPDLGDTPSAADVTNAVAGAADPQVKAKVDAANYNDFRAWAGKVKTAGGSDAGAQGVMEADNAWISYALGQGTLLEVAPTDADLSVETFEPTAEAGKFDFTVSVGTIVVGSTAAKENLKKVFGLEGAATLDGATFLPENVDVEFGTPEGGKVKFTAGPKDASAGTFFMKVKMLP